MAEVFEMESLAGESCVTPFDVHQVRAQFPALSQTINDKPIAYLDNGASTQKPEVVIDAIGDFYRSDYANIHRGVHTLSQRATDAYEGARRTVADFLGADRVDEIVFTRGTTESINLVASSFVQPRLKPGDRIVISHMEHHANIVPWQILAKKTGADLRIIPINDAGEINVEAAVRLLDKRTKFLSLVHVSNALGTVNPVEPIVGIAHDRGIPTMLDGAQAVAHLPIDIDALGCDFYAFSSHKLYGPTGIGVLWGKHKHLSAMQPYQAGGDMIRSVSFAGTTFAPPPARFEAGTPHIAGAVGLSAALDWFTSLDRTALLAHEEKLLAYITEQFQKHERIRIIGTASAKVAVTSFVVDGIHPHDLGTILDQHGVAIRAGHHCAQPVMERFGIPATARASIAAYSTFEEADQLMDALEDAMEMFS